MHSVCSLLLQIEWRCLCVGNYRDTCKNGRTDRVADRGQTRVGPSSHALEGGGTLTPPGTHDGSFDLCGGGDAACRYRYCDNLFTATSSKMTHSAQRPISFFVAFRSVQRRRSEDVILQLPTVLKYIIIVGTLRGRQAVCRAV